MTDQDSIYKELKELLVNVRREYSDFKEPSDSDIRDWARRPIL